MGRKKGKGKGRAARNARVNQTADSQEEQYSKAPHSFVFHRGHVGKTVKELVLDVRKIMEPYTASNLKVRKKNVMKDFLTVAGPMHVSHFIVFTKTDVAVYMRLICVPRGPTLTFKVNEFTLARDVLSFQKHPDVEAKLFNNHAVMVTNLPTDDLQNKLMNVTFKNMFPSINPNTVRLNTMRRTVLINYDPENKTVDLRHYTMKVVPTGISRAMKKLMKSKLPDLSKHADIADVFLDKGVSDSEGEQEGPHSQVTVTQEIKDRGVAKNTTNAIRLKEVGPRLTLQLVKIEEGFEAGNVLFHAHVEKTPEELEAMKAMKEKKRKEKLARKQKQEADVKKKKEAKEEQIKKTLEGMKKKKQEEGVKDEEKDEDEEKDASDNDAHESEDSDDDREYFKKEVGVEPEPELFTEGRKRKGRSKGGPVQLPKRFKKDHQAMKKEKGKQKPDGKKGPSKFKFSQRANVKEGDARKGKTLHNKVKKPKFKPNTKKRKGGR